MKINIGCLDEYIFEEDLIYLIGYWRVKNKFCDDIKKLTLDDGREFVVFQGCNFQALLIIFAQCSYLTLIPNEDRLLFIHSGEDLEIELLFQINWTYEL